MSIFDPIYIDGEIDTKLKSLVFNRLDKDTFDSMSAHSPDDIWFIQDSELSGQPIVVDTRPVEMPTKLSEFQNDVPYLSAVSWSQVTGKPTIPTQTSQLTNNSGFITSAQASRVIWTDWDVTSASTAYVTTNYASFSTGVTWTQGIRLEFSVRGTSQGRVTVGNSSYRFFNTSPGSIEGANVYFDLGGHRIYSLGVWDVSEWYDVEVYNYGYVCTPRDGSAAITNSGSVQTFSGNYTIGIGESGLSFDFGYLRIYDGDVLVKSYLPSLDANQVACMYEEVSQQYEYPSSGSWIYHDM